MYLILYKSKVGAKEQLLDLGNKQDQLNNQVSHVA